LLERVSSCKRALLSLSLSVRDGSPAEDARDPYTELLRAPTPGERAGAPCVPCAPCFAPPADADARARAFRRLATHPLNLASPQKTSTVCTFCAGLSAFGVFFMTLLGVLIRRNYQFIGEWYEPEPGHHAPTLEQQDAASKNCFLVAGIYLGWAAFASLCVCVQNGRAKNR